MIPAPGLSWPPCGLGGLVVLDPRWPSGKASCGQDRGTRLDPRWPNGILWTGQGHKAGSPLAQWYPVDRTGAQGWIPAGPMVSCGQDRGTRLDPRWPNGILWTGQGHKAGSPLAQWYPVDRTGAQGWIPAGPMVSCGQDRGTRLDPRWPNGILWTGQGHKAGSPLAQWYPVDRTVAQYWIPGGLVVLWTGQGHNAGSPLA